MNSGRRGENRLWKRVTPTVTEFAWLPPNLAESFCKNALYRDDVRTYCAFDTPHWDWTRRTLWLMSLLKTFCI